MYLVFFYVDLQYTLVKKHHKAFFFNCFILQCPEIGTFKNSWKLFLKIVSSSFCQNSTCILLFSERENKPKNCEKHDCLYTFSVLHFFFITDGRLYCNQYKVVALLHVFLYVKVNNLPKKFTLANLKKKEENSSVKVCRSLPVALIS